MLVRTQSPALPLAPLVESITLVVDPNYPWQREAMFPDGAVDLLINLGPDDHAAVLPGETRRRTYRRAWLSGLRRGPLVIERARHGYNLLIVRFRPGGAAALVDCALSELTDRVVELEELWGRTRVEELTERLVHCVTPNEAFAELECILEEHRNGHAPSHLLRGALRFLQSAALGMSMREIVASLGTSHSRLIRTFEREVGVKPKLLQRVLRFQRAIQLESARPALDWTAIAHHCGYYDHPHLTREFRAFTGMAPRDYRARRADYPNYIPLD